MWENNHAGTKVSGKSGRGGAPDTGAEIPLQLMVLDHGEAAVPLQATEVHGERPPTVRGGGADAAAAECLEGVVSP